MEDESRVCVYERERKRGLEQQKKKKGGGVKSGKEKKRDKIDIYRSCSELFQLLDKLQWQIRDVQKGCMQSVFQ